MTFPDKKIIPHRKWITIGVMMGLSLAALEITVVGTAAPSIVKDLGGFNAYSWLFTMYLLTSTVMMPFWGRAADHWGRKPVFLSAMIIFLIGSILCGMSDTFNSLIFFRGVQGIGAGGLVPIAFTIFTDIYDIKTRAKIQGYIASVWGVSSAIGPFIGGALAETFHWRVIFLFNVFPGIVAITIIALYFKDIIQKTGKLRLSIQSLQVSFLFVISMMLSLQYLQNEDHRNGGLFGAVSILSFLLFLQSEKNAEFPLIPKELFKHRLFNMACVSGFFSSAMIMGMAGFIPLLYQTVFQYSATESGLVLFPFTLSWLVASIPSARMILTRPYKNLLAFGFITTCTGFSFLMLFFDHHTIYTTTLWTIIMGIGMAFNYPIILITTQYDVPKNMIGFSTSGIFWVRHLGGIVGTSLMGLTLATTFKAQTLISVSKPNLSKFKYLAEQKFDILLKPENLSIIQKIPELQNNLTTALFWAFIILLICTGIVVSTIFFFPASKEVQERINLGTQ